jgi:hypothetical protein
MGKESGGNLLQMIKNLTNLIVLVGCMKMIRNTVGVNSPGRWAINMREFITKTKEMVGALWNGSMVASTMVNGKKVSNKVLVS